MRGTLRIAGEVEHGRLQLDRDRVSYLAPNYEPLIESGQMTLLIRRESGRIRRLCRGFRWRFFRGIRRS